MFSLVMFTFYFGVKDIINMIKILVWMLNEDNDKSVVRFAKENFIFVGL